MAKKRSPSKTKPRTKRATRDLPVRSASKVKGGVSDSLATMSDLSSQSAFNLQTTATQVTRAQTTQSTASKTLNEAAKNMIGNI